MPRSPSTSTIRPSVVPLALFVVLLGVACDSASTQGACTQIGCLNGIRMEIEGEIPVGTRFTLTPTDPGGVARSITCDAESPCQSVIQVEDFTPESFTVSATGPDLDYEQTFAPDYETLQPNGPDCPPTCRVATIVVDLR